MFLKENAFRTKMICIFIAILLTSAMMTSQAAFSQTGLKGNAGHNNHPGISEAGDTKYQFQLAIGNFLEQNILMDTVLTDTRFQFPYELDGPETYRWRVRVVGDFEGPWSISSFQTQGPVSTEVEGELPVTYILSQNYPNPFNPTTVIEYALPVRSHVTLHVYDLLGRQIRILVDSEMQEGYHRAVFDMGDLSSGVYLYRLEADPADGSNLDKYVRTRYMTIIK